MNPPCIAAWTLLAALVLSIEPFVRWRIKRALLWRRVRELGGG